MKAIEIFFWFSIGLVAGVYLLAALAKWVSKQRKYEDQYEKLYARIQRDMRDLEPYSDIKSLFDQLRALKWQNPEKTKVLYDQFMKQYSKDAKAEREYFVKESLIRHIEKLETAKA